VQERRVDEPECLPPELQLVVVADDAEGEPGVHEVVHERLRGTGEEHRDVGFRSSSSISAPAWSGSEWLTIT